MVDAAMSLGASFPDFSRFLFSSLQMLDQKMKDGDNEETRSEIPGYACVEYKICL